MVYMGHYPLGTPAGAPSSLVSGDTALLAPIVGFIGSSYSTWTDTRLHGDVSCLAY